MTGFIKIKSKALLLNNTLKLFFVSLIAFILKSSVTILTVLSMHFILVSNIFQSLLVEYNSLIVYFIYSLFAVTSFFLLFLFISGLKTGENAIYFMQSKGSKAKLKYLFIFLRPSQSFRSFCLYTRIFILKSLWGIFLYLPSCFCLILTLYLYFSTVIYTTVFLTLIFGAVFLLSISRFYYNCISVRYSFASYYLCTDLNISVKTAINKSTHNSDGFIKDGVYLKSSMLIWFLCCIFIIPAIYVIPFNKLSKAKFITFCDGLHYALPQGVKFKTFIRNNGVI
ncbi:MAG: hypothetical protein J6Q87_04635 [Clostridia bacterium]|nr:hypothetical protein [Clostridia bacterium]